MGPGRRVFAATPCGRMTLWTELSWMDRAFLVKIVRAHWKDILYDCGIVNSKQFELGKSKLLPGLSAAQGQHGTPAQLRPAVRQVRGTGVALEGRARSSPHPSLSGSPTSPQAAKSREPAGDPKQDPKQDPNGKETPFLEDWKNLGDLDHGGIDTE